jgi:outer membrane protein, adhesin transport system
MDRWTRFFCALVAMAALVPVAAQAQSLSDSVRIAISTNAKVESTIHGREAVDQDLRRARGLYFPQIDLRGSAGPEYMHNILTLGSNAERFRTEIETVLTQRLYDGGAVTAEVDRQKGRVKSAAYRVRENAEFVGLDAVEAHLDVLRLRQILAYADENVRSHEALLERVRRRSTGGAGRAADVAQATGRLEDAESAREETRGLLQDAEGRYLLVVGNPPGTLEEAEPPIALLTTGIEDALKQLQASNPTVKAREAEIDAAQAGVDAADARFAPLITLEVGGMKDRNVDGFPGPDDEARALLVLRWNLYAGGADIANRRSAYAQVAQAKSVRLEALRQAEQDLRSAWSAYDAAQRRVPLLKSAVGHTLEVRNAFDQQFQVGQRTLLDLLDSENELFQAQTRLATVRRQAVFDGYRILAVEGMLLGALNVPPPPEADYRSKTATPERPAKGTY